MDKFEAKEADIYRLPDNFFRAIGKEWMLITSGTPERFNTMTASWGGIGYLWNRPVAFFFIRPERYTCEFTERNPEATLSFLGEENRSVHSVCGSTSGRDTDKIARTGLVPQRTPSGNIAFGQARLTLECKILYSEQLSSGGLRGREPLRWYTPQEGGWHRMYIAEILHAWVKD